ncbi:VOC family protein [Pseudonocardia endophytica]|uniref:VOC family protein n=1 Tax=Pseudonocardia endophytica TaxID=401976 RepID=UPI001FB34B76|nr:VOC family protein [Pseudonocardia endophytica]
MPDDSPQARIGNVHHPVGDVGAAVAFYTDAFGLSALFTDGDRYAALDAGGTKLALAGPAEDVTGGVAAPSFKVDDVAAALERLTSAGGTVVRDAEAGPHETRAVARDPWGNTVIVYGPR